jgi:hypothetical protein
VNFTPPHEGLFTMTAINTFAYDKNNGNDTLVWHFVVLGSSSVSQALESGHRSSLTIYPNPARDIATLEYTIPTGMAARVRLYDANGQAVGTLAELHEKGAGHIALGFGGLPSGAYTVAIESGAGVIASQTITIQH